MLILLYFLILLMLFSCRSSRTITFIAVIYMFCLFAFNTGNVDYETYEEAFYTPTLRIASWEIGFVGLMILLYDWGLEISSLYTIISLFYISTLIFIIKHITKDKINHFFFFFLINTFLLHIVQLRFSTASIFVLWGFGALLKINNKKIAVLIFLMCISVASCFHVISIIFLLYLLPFCFDIKKTFLISSVFLVILFTGSIAVPTLFSNNPLLFRMTKLAGDYSSSSVDILRFTGCLTELIIYILMFRKIYRFERINNYKDISIISKTIDNTSINMNNDLNFSGFCYGLSIVGLILIPLLLISTELHRILSVVNIILLSAAIYFTKIKKMQIVIYGCLLCIALIISYFYIWGGNYDNFVFKPILMNNSVFN